MCLPLFLSQTEVKSWFISNGVKDGSDDTWHIEITHIFGQRVRFALHLGQLSAALPVLAFPLPAYVFWSVLGNGKPIGDLDLIFSPHLPLEIWVRFGLNP